MFNSALYKGKSNRQNVLLKTHDLGSQYNPLKYMILEKTKDRIL